MIVIKSKCGSIFQGINENYIDAEITLNISYYKAQGCIIETVESFTFNDLCNCEHCESLEHKFEELIEEIKES